MQFYGLKEFYVFLFNKIKKEILKFSWEKYA